MPYPAAGTANAVVDLALVDLDGTRTAVDLGDGTAYLADVAWSVHDLLVTVSTRDQRRVDVRRVDPDTGETTVAVRAHRRRLGRPRRAACPRTCPTARSCAAPTATTRAGWSSTA